MWFILSAVLATKQAQDTTPLPPPRQFGSDDVVGYVSVASTCDNGSDSGSVVDSVDVDNCVSDG